MVIDETIQPEELLPSVHRLWEASAAKIVDLEESWPDDKGAPVFTAEGRYTTRGWTDWTQGFRYGSALLQFEATGEREFLDIAMDGILRVLPNHVTHFGVHDHGFNIISTYGTLRRMILEGKAPEAHLAMCDLALRCSGAVQARRWTSLPQDPARPTSFAPGFIYSFNGPHSLFIDTMRSLRSLAMAHLLGQRLFGEQDACVSLLERLCAHAAATATYSVYYGEGRDAYDELGRTAHESLFNPVNGSYRCPSTQQGYSPFSTWTRGLAWAMCGFAEELELFLALPDLQSEPCVADALPLMRRAAAATCDFYLRNTPTDGVPYWDTGAPGLRYMGDYLARPAEPYNDHEPVDSSAAAIAAQGLIRFGRFLRLSGETDYGGRLEKAGLTIAEALLDEPYLSVDPSHQGLLLHSVYHRPNGWDHIPAGRRIPCGEASMWGDYHLRELALLIQRLASGEPYLTFFGEIPCP